MSAERVNPKLIDLAARVLKAAQAQGNQEAYSLAFTLESACLLQSPETAVEVDCLRARVAELEAERHSTNEALSDAAEQLRVQRDRIAELEGAAEKVAGFCAKRAEYVDNINNCSPSNDRDYWRWNGHAEARRQLSQLLGLPVGWPVEDQPAPVPQQRQVEDPHDSPLHHDYAESRDLPIPRQVTGRCPKGHTFEDCTCGGTQ